METAQDIQFNLRQFTGSVNLYRQPFLSFKYTDGVKYLADAAQCYWLLDHIQANQHKIDKNEFQVWEIKKIKSKSKFDVEIIGTSEDYYGTEKTTKKKLSSDFPLDEVKLFYRDGVLMLASEY